MRATFLALVAMMICGPVPPMPPLPPGCTVQYPVCYCDDSGNCTWVWVCQP